MGTWAGALSLLFHSLSIYLARSLFLCKYLLLARLLSLSISLARSLSRSLSLSLSLPLPLPLSLSVFPRQVRGKDAESQLDIARYPALRAEPNRCFFGSWRVLVLAGIWWLLVHIKSIEKGNLLPLNITRLPSTQKSIGNTFEPELFACLLYSLPPSLSPSLLPFSRALSYISSPDPRPPPSPPPLLSPFRPSSLARSLPYSRRILAHRTAGNEGISCGKTCDFYTFALILLVKIVLGSKFH